MGTQQPVTEWVRDALPRVPSPEAAKHAAIIEAIAGGWWSHPGALAKVSGRAGEIEEERVERAREQTISGAALMTNGIRGLNQRLWESLEPRVKALRSKLFGQDAAPFETPTAAVAWIEQDAPVRANRFRVTASRPDDPVLEQLRALTREAPPEPVGFLKYQKPGVANAINRPVPPSGPLFDLYSAVSEWADDTNFPKDALTMIVLRGGQPVLPPARVTFHYSSHAPCSASLHLYAPDLTFEQLRRIHRHLRDAWPKSEPQPGLSEADVVVLGIREQLGPPPQRGRHASAPYWKQFFAMMRKAKITEARHANAAKMALLRAERAARGESRTHRATSPRREARRRRAAV